MYTRPFLVIATVLIAAFLAVISPPAVAQVQEMYRIVVEDTNSTGRQDRLKKFHKQLLQSFSVSDLGEKNIGCQLMPKTFPLGTSCKLVEDPTRGAAVIGFTFALMRDTGAKSKLTVFMNAYNSVQSNLAIDSASFVMHIDGTSTPGPACPMPLPPGCGTRKICVQTDQCDKPVGGACAVCPAG